MTRLEFVKTMQAYVENLKKEYKEKKSILSNDPTNRDLYHMVSKIDHEISAIENAIREMQRL